MNVYIYIVISIHFSQYQSYKRIDDEVSIQLKPKTSRTRSWSFLLVKKGKLTMINDLNHLNEDFSIECILFHHFAHKKSYSYMKWYKENPYFPQEWWHHCFLLKERPTLRKSRSLPGWASSHWSRLWPLSCWKMKRWKWKNWKLKHLAFVRTKFEGNIFSIFSGSTFVHFCRGKGE